MSELGYLQARVKSLTAAISATTSKKLKVAWKIDLDATTARLAELPASGFFKVTGSPWNVPLPDDVPIRSDSALLVKDLQRMLARSSVGWWINSDAYSSHIYKVTPASPRVPVTAFHSGTMVPYPQKRSTTQPGPELAWRFAQGVPVPEGAEPAVGTDKHMCVIDVVTGELWEMWLMGYDQHGIPGWSCGWGGWMPNHAENIGRYADVAGDARQFAHWGSTGTSLPIAAGMILQAELDAGVIPHALQLLLPDPKDEYVWPAQRTDGLPGKVIPEGSMLRLKPSVNVDALTGNNPTATATLRVMARAMQTYGVIVNDATAAGGVLCFRAEPSLDVKDFGDWPNNMLRAIAADDFEFIDPAYRPA